MTLLGASETTEVAEKSKKNIKEIRKSKINWKLKCCLALIKIILFYILVYQEDINLGNYKHVLTSLQSLC
jgi:hypothetical protein